MSGLYLVSNNMAEKEYNTMYDASHAANRRCCFLTCYASAALLHKVLHAIRGSALPQLCSVAWQHLYNVLSEIASFWVRELQILFFFLERVSHLCWLQILEGPLELERAQCVWLFCFVQACTGNSASSNRNDVIHKSRRKVEIMIEKGTEKLDFQLTLK